MYIRNINNNIIKIENDNYFCKIVNSFNNDINYINYININNKN